MLPRVILMHKLISFHSESQSGGSIELPSKGFLGDFCSKSLFYNHFSFLLGALQGHHPRGSPLQGPQPRQQSQLRGAWAGRCDPPPMAPAQGRF